MNKLVKMSFKKAYDNVPGGEQSALKEAIMSECNWMSSQIFTMKKDGKRGLKNGEIVSLSLLFKEKGIHAFTGEKI